jgi:predicted RND superfamily exporter protein
MVSGMARAFFGSFIVVLVMMSLMFRSPLWGLLSMIPLTLTIGLIYGVIGLIGKDYDMPVAVLSALTLGLAVDFAIHFLVRVRELYSKQDGWVGTIGRVFAEPARAITRNVIVIAVGFTPLLVASLVPYRTVGVLLGAILLVSGVATLMILPALLRIFENTLFRLWR